MSKIRAMVASRIRGCLPSGLDNAVIRGEGYEALVTRNGIVIGRVYIGSIEELEPKGRG